LGDARPVEGCCENRTKRAGSRSRWDEPPRCLAGLVVIDVDGRAHGAHHRVQRALLILKLVLSPLPHGRHRIVATVDEAPPKPSLDDVQALLDARGPRLL
jgi:hypothetical protein